MLTDLGCCHSTYRDRFCSRGRAIGAYHRPRFRIAWEFWRRTFGYVQNLRVAARGLDPYRYAWFSASLLFPPVRREHHTGFEEWHRARVRRRKTRMPSKTVLQAISPLMPARRHEASNADTYLRLGRRSTHACLVCP